MSDHLLLQVAATFTGFAEAKVPADLPEAKWANYVAHGLALTLQAEKSQCGCDFGF